MLTIANNIKDYIEAYFASFSFSSVITLIFGVIIGVLLCLFFYLITILINIKEKSKVVQSDVKDSDIKECILSKQREYKELATNNTNVKISLLKDLSLELVNDISKMYYPKSKHSAFEISISELLVLNHYITKRIEEVFDNNVLKLIKNLKISTILNFYDKKKAIEDSKIVKDAKKLHLGAVKTVAFTALNLINPAYWIRKGANKVVVRVSIDKICLIILEIVGTESAKVYSKNVFNDDSEIDLESIME